MGSRELACGLVKTPTYYKKALKDLEALIKEQRQIIQGFLIFMITSHLLAVPKRYETLKFLPAPSPVPPPPHRAAAWEVEKSTTPDAAAAAAPRAAAARTTQLVTARTAWMARTTRPLVLRKGTRLPEAQR